MKRVIVLLLINSLLSAEEISLTITGIKPEKGGDLLLFLYKKENWMKVDEPIIIEKGITETELKTVIPTENGNYALRVVHDHDENGKLTMKWFPPAPKEGYGFSAGYEPKGIPKYAPAEFIVDGDEVIEIEMIYPK